MNAEKILAVLNSVPRYDLEQGRGWDSGSYLVAQEYGGSYIDADKLAEAFGFERAYNGQFIVKGGVK